MSDPGHDDMVVAASVLRGSALEYHAAARGLGQAEYGEHPRKLERVADWLMERASTPRPAASISTFEALLADWAHLRFEIAYLVTGERKAPPQSEVDEWRERFIASGGARLPVTPVYSMDPWMRLGSVVARMLGLREGCVPTMEWVNRAVLELRSSDTAGDSLRRIADVLREEFR